MLVMTSGCDASMVAMDRNQLKEFNGATSYSNH